MATPSPWRIATRRSVLATTQAGHVAAALEKATGRPAELVPMATTGDEHPDRAIESFDAKGLFVDRVRQAVLDRECHLVVHSYKDLPTEPCNGLVIGAVPPRVDPRDALVTRDGHRLATLPRDAKVGTSSARRKAQLARARRDLLIQPLRGNLDTRLRKLDEGQYDAIILAAAGLKRLGLADRIRAELPSEISLPAAGQGALGIECLANRPDVAAWLAPLNDADTSACVRAERAVSRALAGSCEVPLGAYGEIRAGQLWLRGFVALPDGSRIVRAEREGSPDDAESLGLALAEELRSQGAEEILASLG